jgi:hypothetical protein
VIHPCTHVNAIRAQHLRGERADKPGNTISVVSLLLHGLLLRNVKSR